MKIPPVLGGAFIIAGTSIGAGMLGLPVVTAQGGLLPAICIYIASWLFMTTTGLLLLEIALRMPKDSNIISMAEKYLGRAGKLCSWFLYLFLFYALSIAYISGGGDLIRDVFSLPTTFSYILFLAILAPFVYIGAGTVDKINRLLMVGLILSFLLFVLFGMRFINLHFLDTMHWGKATLALPVIFTSFAYQGVIPSLTYYLEKNAKKLRCAIILGTTITFLIYLIWEIFILGIVPLEGENGLIQAQEKGLSAIQPLQYHIKTTFSTLSRFFGFFTITTSFLGVSLGVFDFLSDGLHLEKKGKNKILLALLTFFPPFIVAVFNPGLFLTALRYAGGIGCALLLGLIPILMVWSARYWKKDTHKEAIQLKGGKPLLGILILFLIFEFIVEILGEIIRFS